MTVVDIYDSTGHRLTSIETEINIKSIKEYYYKQVLNKSELEFSVPNAGGSYDYIIIPYEFYYNKFIKFCDVTDIFS